MVPPLLALHDTVDHAPPDHPLEIPRATWQRLARCRDHTDLFFHADDEQPAARGRREQQALRLCAECPVQAECRSAGRAGREIGVWGGETDEQRAAAGYPPRNLARRSVMRAARAGLERSTA